MGLGHRRPVHKPSENAYPELTGQMAKVSAPLDTTRADRGGAASAGDRRALRLPRWCSGKPTSVTDNADRSPATTSASTKAPATAVFAEDAESQTWTPPSWEEIVSTHSARVYRLAYRLTGNQHDAEDLTQEVFVRVFRSLSTYTPGTFEGWLHRITTNLFLDMVRRKQRIRFDALADDAAERLPAASPPPNSTSTTRTSTRTSSTRWTPSPRSSAPRWCSATSRDSRTRRSPRLSGSSSAPCAAVSTGAGPSCASRSSTARPPAGPNFRWSSSRCLSEPSTRPWRKVVHGERSS